MTGSARLAVILSIALAAIAAAVAAFCATHLLTRQDDPPSLGRMVHEELDLSAGQRERIAEAEAHFEARAAPLEAEMRAANARLAAAIEADKSYGAEAEAAIEDFHAAMGALQTETIRHVLAVRELLTPEQQVRYDAVVTASLTEQDL